MPDAPWTKEQLNGLREAVQSLKLYRRAELQDEATGQPLVEYLYVDPLPHDHVFHTIIKSNTTFLIGRKGTGKSTVISRAQHELRKNRKVLSTYIDIKTVYESATGDRSAFENVADVPNALSREQYEKFLLNKAFIAATIQEIRNELSERVKSSIWDQLKENFTGTVEMLFEGLDEILQDANTPRFLSVLGSKRIDIQQSQKDDSSGSGCGTANATLSTTPELSLRMKSSTTASHSEEEQLSFSDILIRTFNIKDLVVRLRDLLKSVGVERLYVFVDDFSELPQDAMEIVVDSLLAPLNNWSSELVKFKVAAYPGRIYYGDIDKSKIDEVYLDTFNLYGGSDVSTMEEKAIDFTRLCRKCALGS